MIHCTIPIAATPSLFHAGGGTWDSAVPGRNEVGHQ